jgi:periplasmic glucans biosynthesis protein
MTVGRGVTVVVLVLGVLAPASRARGFDFTDVVAKAKQVAQEAYRDDQRRVPEWMRQISYDQWRDIRFRPEHALWKAERGSFQAQFFHPGLFYDRTVGINVVEGKKVRPVTFSPSQFDYGANDFASKVPQDLGYAGFRVHYPINRPDYHDEVIVFLGASYFRAVGRKQVFGMSARALAIDTALPSGEEFPYFREFWLVRPPRDAKEMTVFALLDSASASGAYEFVVRPGTATIVRVQSQVFMRREVGKLGIAPLTSMYWHGENTLDPPVDFRPEVHDSDGLLLSFNTGEWLWRALDIHRVLHTSAYQMQSPKGFGLLQRDRDFVASYQDLEARYDLRPSVWIEPHGDWATGTVELLEIPTDSDANDNVGAFWIPKNPPKAGESIAAAYTMHWYGEDPRRSPGGRTIATRRDFGTQENVQRFVVDFHGKALQAIPNTTVLRGAITVIGGPEAGEIVDQHVVKNDVTNGWRLVFQVRPVRAGAIDLRGYLDKGGEALTETWSSVLVP